MTGSGRLLCPFCISGRFEDPNPDRFPTMPGVMLPESVAYFDAMWRFDRAGGLRELLHHLKYDGLVQIGHELGRLVGENVIFRGAHFADWTPENTRLVPVPMHRGRLRIRGYNQAEEIAKGLSEVSGIPILAQQAVLRVRATRSQTGFGQIQRAGNMKGAFRVQRPDCVEGLNMVIIDDVFTTGATTFELSDVLMESGALVVAVVTVAAT